MSSDSLIRVRGARQNNLRGFDVDLPLGQLIVVTGPSGSGKSSFAFDTLYAEGQRRYVETFSPYTRQFLERMDKPRVESIEGIPPAIAIEQANYVKTTRSTVGTITEINDYLKQFMPRVARAFCPECGREVRPETAKSIVEDILATRSGQTLLVAFGVNVPEDQRGRAREFYEFLQGQGYLRVWLDGVVRRTDEEPGDRRLPAVVRVIQDRVVADKKNAARLAEAVETALRFGKEQVEVIDEQGVSHPYSKGWHCAHCDVTIRPPTPALFSFNNPQGACPECRGFGRVIGIDLDRALPDKSLSIAEGVVKAFSGTVAQESQRDLLRACARRHVNVHVPFRDLPKADQDFVIYGERGGGDDIHTQWENGEWYGVKGFFDWLESRTYKMHVRVFLSRYRSYNPCPKCNGGRFQPETLNYRLVTEEGKKTLPELTAMPVKQLRAYLEAFPLPPGDSAAELLHHQIVSRLGYLETVGLGYLTLDRPTRTLSGGEIERVNLTTCLGASLVNTLFVMDEPSVGLHPRDVDRLLEVMHGLRDKGNTLVVVEHEEAVLRAADYMVDIGPGRGVHGGALVYAGPAENFSSAKKSLTADYLTGRKAISVPEKRRQPEHFLMLRGARHHNIRGENIRIPLGVFCSVTGVSGSGKSTLVRNIIYRNLCHEGTQDEVQEIGHCDAIEGLEYVDDVVLVDQSPLSRTPRSTPALYLGAFDAIRQLFGFLPEANAAGMTPSTFSFNSGNGRCERCAGLGFEKVEMQFLSDLFLRCPECQGTRYQERVLEIKLDGKSIHDVLEMTIAEAIAFFADKEKKEEITAPLQLMAEVGLDYLKLGQPLNVLSGGESQRLKLVHHLATRKGERALLILDEPTTGLHFDDVARLLEVFQRLVADGNSLLVIEHNLEVIKSADWILDLGPEAGADGGKVVAEGTPEEVSQCEQSHTGRFLRKILTRKETREKEARKAPPRSRSSTSNAIRVSGAREHNLKNVDVLVPRDKMVVVTGLSGSGKSTLAFDILFAEGQRRFLDSMSPYARQFVEQLEKPDVDLIEGLPPSVAIEQRITRGGGKSTVATVTEVHHFVRLLYAKLGTQYCPDCNRPVESTTPSAIVDHALRLAGRGEVEIFAPLVRSRKGYHTDVARWALRQGFETLLVDGKLHRADAFPKLTRYQEHSIDVLIGRFGKGQRADAEMIVRRALDVGRGTARLRRRDGSEAVLSTEMSCSGCGRAFEPLDPRLFSFNSPHGWCPGCRGFGEVWSSYGKQDEESPIEAELAEERAHENLEEGEAQKCALCRGGRLNDVALSVRVGEMGIADFLRHDAPGALKFLKKFRPEKGREEVARDILTEIVQRLEFLSTVGLDYLTLDRSTKTLSGGESQRIRLAAQLGSNLRGVLYVLDEPTIGLHPRDNVRLLDALGALVHKGNSLVVVEHDDETMRRADYILDLGPRAGVHGGEIVAQGPLKEILSNKESLTGRFLREPLKHPIRGSRRSLKTAPGWIELKGARRHNLQSVDVKLPVGRFSVITGVSGSGKSSLMRGTLMPAVKQALGRSRKKVVRGDWWDDFLGGEFLDGVVEVDQSPIGKTSRSTPATYIKVFDEIRKHFAQLPEARLRGYTASRFSFNNEGGRCERCQGQGVIKLEMNFLPPSYMPCEDCGGMRYNPPTLEVTYNGKSIGDVMEMTVEQAAEFFDAVPKIAHPLRLLAETGLGYLKLGQPSPTLSGGEAQRIKLVTELARGENATRTKLMRGGRVGKSTLYLLEEPTIGLHMADVERLLQVIHRMVDAGATVVVIEHNMSLVAEADYLVDVGPEAGERGGKIVACGTPEQVAKSKTSRTAPFLREVLSGRHTEKI